MQNPKFLIAVLMSLSLKVFAANEIKYDYNGLTIDKNNIAFDGTRWNLTTNKNRSVFSNIEKKNVKVEVVRDDSGSIVGVGDPDGSETYTFKDAILKENCSKNTITSSSCFVNHEFCKNLSDKLQAIDECNSKNSKTWIEVPLPTDSQLSLFPTVKKNYLMGTRALNSVEAKYSDTTIELIRVCSDLKTYSSPEAPVVPAAKDDAKAVQQ